MSADERSRLSSPRGRWIVVAVATGSGVAFLDGSVVTVALPAIRGELGHGFALQQWIVDGYLLSLSSLLLLGGALGDRWGRRRVFVTGLALFAVASGGCGLAPSFGVLVAARVVQGVGAALLIPGSLTLIDSAISAEDRGRAIGRWAALSGVASAIGPFLGGWLAGAASWRWIFLINLPLSAAAVAATLRFVPESRARSTARLDTAGVALGVVAVASTTFALVHVSSVGWSPLGGLAVVTAVLSASAFVVVERGGRAPLIPLGLFRSKQFSGANAATFLLYAALGGVFFIVPLQLEQSLRYSSVSAGLAVVPFTVLMLLLSAAVGGISQRIGPRWAMTFGPVVAGIGVALLTLAVPGASYWRGVFIGIAVFGLGMAITAAPLTSTVLASVSGRYVGAASGINNAVSRIAGLIAVAALPSLSGIHTAHDGPLGPGYRTAMLACSLLCFAAGAISLGTVSASVRLKRQALPGLNHACQPPATRLETGRFVRTASSGRVAAERDTATRPASARASGVRSRTDRRTNSVRPAHDPGGT